MINNFNKLFVAQLDRVLVLGARGCLFESNQTDINLLRHRVIGNSEDFGSSAL